MNTVSKVRFPPGGAFHADLKRRVAAHFQSRAAGRHGGWRMALKTAVMFCWLAASYGLLMVGPSSAWQAVLLAMSLGLAMAGVGFAVMHDANHGSYARRRRFNNVLAYSLDFIGGSSFLWRYKHNILHHTYPNVAGMDTDGEAGPALRLTPAQRHRRFHRFQHVYAWPLYALFVLKWWFVDDFRELLTGRIGGHPYPPPRGRQLAGLLGGKAVFFGWAFVLPALVHPTWAVVGIWLIASTTLGVVLATVFQLAHCVGDAAHHESSSGCTMPTDWAEHQVATTVDFARGNRLLGWYLGGLNFQVEHHLFPKVCHIHYRELSAIVEQCCRDHGLRYLVQPTLRAAVGANVRWLRQLGRGGEPTAGVAAG